MWLSSHYKPNCQWWAGQHTSAPFARPHLTDRHSEEEDAWSLIRYKLWHTKTKHAPSYLTEAYYADPDPTTNPGGSNSRPAGHWHAVHNRQGEETYNKYWDTACPGRRKRRS